MAKMSLTESHRCTSVASGWSRSGFPVFFLYSLRAWLKPASRIDLKSEDGVDLCAGVDDMMFATVRLLVMIAEWQEFGWEASHCLRFRIERYQCLGTWSPPGPQTDTSQFNS